MGETINFWGSLVCLTGCLWFIVVYTIMPFVTGREGWWRSHIGRLLITKAVSIAGLMLIVISLYAFDLDLEWVRSARGIFASVVGVMMMYQGWLVIKIMGEREETRS